MTYWYNGLTTTASCYTASVPVSAESLTISVSYGGKKDMTTSGLNMSINSDGSSTVYVNEGRMSVKEFEDFLARAAFLLKQMRDAEKQFGKKHECHC